MKRIFLNQYVNSFRFTSKGEMSAFIDKQQIKNGLDIEDAFGDNYYCYISYHALTREKEFFIAFSSDEKEEDLNLLYWLDSKLMVLDTGRNLYLIDQRLSIKASFEITTPLIGLFITKSNKLVVLEEVSFRLINSLGEILLSEVFDLIEDVIIDDFELRLKTADRNKVIDID